MFTVTADYLKEMKDVDSSVTCLSSSLLKSPSVSTNIKSHGIWVQMPCCWLFEGDQGCGRKCTLSYVQPLQAPPSLGPCVLQVLCKLLTPHTTQCAAVASADCWCSLCHCISSPSSPCEKKNTVNRISIFFFLNSSSSRMDGRKFCPIRWTPFIHFVCVIWKFPKEPTRRIFGIGWLYLRSWGNTSIWNATWTKTSNSCTWVWQHVCVNQLLLFLWITLTFNLYFAYVIQAREQGCGLMS